jgi:FtsH-binding integral membrane protein
MNQLTPLFPGAAGPTAGVRANPYIARTYTVFLNALAAIVITGVLSHQYLPRTALTPLAIADSVMWIACGWFGWRRPLTFVMGLFAVITGALLGQIAHLTPGSIFAQTSAYTLATFAGLSFYVHITKKDFSFLRGFLVAAFWIMIVSTIILLFFPGARAMMPFSAFGTLVFAGWILYDTSNVVHRTHDFETAGFAAFELMLSLVGLFHHLLNLLWSFAED